MNRLRELLDDARSRLADAPREAVGEVVQPRRLFGIARAPRIVPHGEAWHLGVLLLMPDAVLATGEVVRSRTPARRGYTAENQRRRAELAEAAHRGGYAEGTTVHVGWSAIDLDAVARGEASGPLSLVGGEPMVRWSAAGAAQPLAAYLDERVELLRRPPEGA